MYKAEKLLVELYHGSVVLWTSRPPQEQKTRVRILPGRDFIEKHSIAVVYRCVDFVCLCVLEKRYEGIGRKLSLFEKKVTCKD
jgi:hypothetical protein